MKCALTLIADEEPPRDIDVIEVPTAPYPGDTIKQGERVYAVLARSFMPAPAGAAHTHKFGCAVRQIAGPPHITLNVGAAGLSLVKN